MTPAQFDHSPQHWARFRGKAVAICVGLIFLAVTFRASIVSLGAAPLAGNNKTVSAFQARSEIVDRKGELLAASLAFDSLAANPQAIWDPEEVAQGLATVLDDLDLERLTAQLSDTTREFVWIRRKVSPRQREAIYGLGLEGLEFRRETQRVYPGGPLGGHVLGFSNVDMKGIAGVELAYEDRLAAGGEALRLTIDDGAQFAMEEELAAAAAEYQIKGAAGIVIEAKTGAIRALASWPPVDPNRPGDANADARLNRAVGAVYELGSVFKPLTVASALDAGVLRPSDLFDVSEPIQLGSFLIKDDHPIDHIASATDIIAHSSNIGTVKIAERVGERRQRDFLASVGLMDRPVIEFPGAARPLVPERWTPLVSATVSYGHGIAVSPLSLAAAYTAFANDGEMASLRLIEPEPFEDIERRRVMSAPTAGLVLHMMRETVTRGTGGRADVQGYEVAGKTGTAEKPVPGGYDVDRNVNSFVAVFPASRPEYVVLIVLDEPLPRPGEGRTAAFNAAPTAGRIIARIAPKLDVQPVFAEEPATTPGHFPADVRTVSDQRAL